MAVTVAHSDVAMKKWLSIVGAERSGRTAVPHRHGKIVDLYSARLFRLSCGRKQAGQRLARLALSTIALQRYNCQATGFGS